jgi:hypothetical protein
MIVEVFSGKEKLEADLEMVNITILSMPRAKESVAGKAVVIVFAALCSRTHIKCPHGYEDTMLSLRSPRNTPPVERAMYQLMRERRFQFRETVGHSLR